MKTSNPKTRRSVRHLLGGRLDRRGSAIVLVLVSIVLMAILAATLLQVTRFERIPRPVSNIDIVIESVVDEILNQATSDLLDNNGKMFNAQFTFTNGAGDEAWDFPYTNPGPSGALTPGGFGRKAERIDGTLVDVLGGAFDDTWLAASAPDFRGATAPNSINIGTNSTNGVWRKITSLTGIYLYGAGGSRDLSTRQQPDERPVTTNVNALNSDSNLDIPNPTNVNGSLVDSDGDGIGDSRWEWAPLRQIGTTRYVMAVRIIDLSARVDLNVATGQYDGSSLGAGEARGDSPAEIDGSGFAAITANQAGSGISPVQAQNEWRNLLGYRLTGNPAYSLPAAPGIMRYDGNSKNASPASRYDYWTRGAARVSSTFSRNAAAPTPPYDYGSSSTFGIVDAFELLQRNGLNSSNTTQVEELMPNFLRAAGVEDNFVTTGSGVGPGNTWDMQNFWRLDPRKMVSPFTGSMAVIRPTRTALNREPKLDVNQAVTSAAGVSKLRLTIKDVMDASNPAWLSRYPHLTSTDDLASQLTANIIDFIDRDNVISVVNGKAGLEALPYITEVYTQRLYVATNVVPPVAPAVTDTVTWLAPPGFDQGYAIEIGNPFASKASGSWKGRPVSLENVFIKVGSSTVELSTLSGVPLDKMLDPGEVLILHRNSRGNPTASQDDISNLITGGMNKIVVDVTNDARFNWPGGNSQTIELRAKTVTGGSASGSGTTATWPYSACEVRVSAAGFNEQVTAGKIMPGNLGYVQTNYQGVGDGLRMMTVTARPQSASPTAAGFGDNVATLDKPSDNFNAGSPTLSITPAFADEQKPSETTFFAGMYGTDQQIALADNPRERLHWVGDILQIPIIGPNPGAAGINSLTAAEFNKNTTLRTLPAAVGLGIEALMLPYKMHPSVAAAPLGTRGVAINGNAFTTATGLFGVFNYPHGLMLLEQLTAYNPAMDGFDGDGESDAESINTPDQGELLVAGKLNLNTATEDTLIRALPFPDLATRVNIARTIIARRENLRQLTDHALGADNVPGIMYPSALYENFQRQAFANNPANDNANNTSLAGTRIDWNDYEDAIGSFPASLDDGVIDDREEEIMLTKWLAEVADTRSDVFAAYIVVQGYSADDFQLGVLESARLIVVFSRANVRTSGDQAVEIGRFRFK